MAFDITENARNAANQINVKPIISMEIDGLGSIFGSSALVTYIRIGDAGLFMNNYNGAPWVIGGFRRLENQFDYVSFDQGGAAKITQSLRADRGEGSSVSRLNIALIDKNEEISQLISPGFTIEEILGRNVIIRLGFENTSYPEDHIIIFRGSVESIDSGPGIVNFGLSSVEEKKRQGIFRKRIAKLTTAISAVGTPTEIEVGDASDFLTPITGPDGLEDPAISFYVRINDEIFQYTGTTATTLTGITRAQLGSVAEAHDVDDKVESIVRIEENGVFTALKIMLSGRNDFFVEDVSIRSFNFVNINLTVPNSIYIADIDFLNKTGVVAGDYVTITGASNPANNQSAVRILEVAPTSTGFYLVLDGTFVQETNSPATMSVRSQFDTFPEGLGMQSFEVDINEHLSLYDLFLSSFTYDFKIEDIKDTKQFLDEQVYLPMSGFSIPRKGQASMGYHIGPIPGSNIKILDSSNVTNADKLVLKRSISINFMNEIRYNYDYNIVTGEFDSDKTYEDATSKALIPIGDKTLEVDALGMTNANQAETLAQAASNRKLQRYAKGAEYVDGVNVLFGTAFNMEIGDIVLVDKASLKLTDTSTGSRSGDIAFFEVSNKTLDSKSGSVQLNLISTAIAVGERYGLISPASKIKSASSAQVFTLEKSFFTSELIEGRKWQNLIGASIIVRSEDFSTFSTSSIITAVTGDQITLDTPLSFTPSAGMIMELSVYDDQPDLIKALYAFFSDGTNDFADGEQPYVFL